MNKEVQRIEGPLTSSGGGAGGEVPEEAGVLPGRRGMNPTKDELNELRRQVEDKWWDRCAAQHHDEDRRLDHQASFFAGAMTVMDALGLPEEKAFPPRWVIAIFRGEDLLNKIREERDGTNH